MNVHKSFAVVENQTGKIITGVSLIHKYSNDYVDTGTWGDFIRDGETSQRLAVSYHTGVHTTGRDWWYISWFNEDFYYYRYSNPNNFRNITDTLEVAAPAIQAAAWAIVSAVTARAGIPALNPALVAASAVAAAAATNTLTTNGATAGFKQHILQSDDAGKTVRIILEKEGKITIQSPSGTSETVYHGRTTGIILD